MELPPAPAATTVTQEYLHQPMQLYGLFCGKRAATQPPHLVQQRVVQVLISEAILLQLSADSQLVAPCSPRDYGVKRLDETLRTRGTSGGLHAELHPH